jgi:hypothetical protein
MSHRETIKETLRQLKAGQAPEDFVIFEDKASGKFVQFTDAILVDLPVAAEDDMAILRAEIIFKNAGLPFTQSKMGNFVTFDMDFGDDVDAAADFALTLFREFHHLPERFELQVKF